MEQFAPSVSTVHILAEDPTPWQWRVFSEMMPETSRLVNVWLIKRTVGLGRALHNNGSHWNQSDRTSKEVPVDNAAITIAIRLWHDYNISHVPASNSMQAKMNISIFIHSRITFVPQSNQTHIVISITSVVVECVVVSSYHSRITIVIYAQVTEHIKLIVCTR